MNNFDLKSYLKNNILLKEEDTPTEKVVDALQGEMDAFIKGLETQLEDQSDNIKEGVITTASIALALPAIMGLIAKVGKKGGELVKKLFGKKPTETNAYDEWMNKLGKIADDLHHLYMAPIEGVVKKFVKDPKKAHTLSVAIFHLIVATFLIASGVTAVQAIQAKNIKMSVLESALTAIKGGEVKEYIAKLLK